MLDLVEIPVIIKIIFLMIGLDGCTSVIGLLAIMLMLTRGAHGLPFLKIDLKMAGELGALIVVELHLLTCLDNVIFI